MSRLSGNLGPSQFDHAVIVHPVVGEVGGECMERHSDGTSTVSWAGQKVRGVERLFVPKGSR